jgi:hypothetical protein
MNKEGVQVIISVYEKFSQISGVKLNVQKTEIVKIGDQNMHQENICIRFKSNIITITPQESVKICGITFSNNKDLAYKATITNKILKMERQLNIWRQSNLSIEGNFLLVKTFGLSQIIYSLQATYIRPEDLNKID